MTQAGKTFLIVSVLTILIWFYADQASSVSDEVVVWLSLRPPGSATWRLADPNTERLPIMVTFAGPARSVSKLQEDLQGDRFRLSYVIEADPPSGPYRIEQLANRLDTLEEVRRRGLRVMTVNPPELTVEVDRLVTRELPVVARADSFKIVQTTNIAPPTVQVTLPASQSEKLEQTEIVADIEAIEAHRELIRVHLGAGDSKPGQPLELNDVPLVRPPGAILKPEWVSVTTVIERRDQTKLLRSVYVRFDVSLDQWQKYDLEVKDNADLALEVMVRGPSDVIASLTPQDVSAFVEISTSDAIKTEGWLTRPVKFVLPPSVILDQTTPQVQFRLVERREGASS
jgi:hypothetical protein